MHDENKIEELKKGWISAFLNQQYDSNLAYRPEFISNDPQQGRKVLTTIDRELAHCDRFALSVAFVTMSGITPLLQTLKELEERKIPGQILTTDYLTFTEPDALDRLAGLKNVQLKVFQTDHRHGGFHTKGYIFEKDEIYHILIGSSNMTLSAVTSNREWNTKITGTRDGEVVADILKEFEVLWQSDDAIAYDEFIDHYRIRYESAKEQKRLALLESPVNLERYKMRPNKMQTAFIRNLRKLVDEGKERALLISATATGKTYASAFGIRDALMPAKSDNQKNRSGLINLEDCPSRKNERFRILFLVHREQIARQAMSSYKNVYGNGKTYGLMIGSREDIDADFVFTTVQTISRSDHLKKFNPFDFNVLVIDEVHHAGAPTYQKVIQYFHPQFILGMTATPERTDGYDIFALFHHNIAYEIRLQQAMEEKLLCPFHYFGITDIAFDGTLQEKDLKEMDQQMARGDYRVFNRLTSDRRVDHILEQADFFGHSGNRVKGLIFVSTKKVGQELSKKMNVRGKRTVFLSGEDPQPVREEAISRLTSETMDPEDQLDYIISVDIFGEGSDVPEINQIIMLRPTQSAIVFVQQLGRGLRIAENKEYLVVLDFIGNYNNNFLIPVALSGDRTYNKDNMRKYIMEGSSIIPGSSTIHFDRVARQRIFESIDQSSTKLQFLKEKYANLKNRLGHIPSILEFYDYGEIDPSLILEHSKTYQCFLQKVDKEYREDFTEEQEAALEFVSSLLSDGKRPHELLMLLQLIDHGRVEKEEFEKQLTEYRIAYRESDYDSAVRILNKEFLNTQSEKKKYAQLSFIEVDYSVNLSNNNIEMQNNQTVSESAFMEVKSDQQAEWEKYHQIKRVNVFARALQDSFFRKAMTDLLMYGLRKYRDFYADGDEDHLVLYQKYSRKDICRLLNWEKDDSQTVYGYRIKYGTCPIFVTYEKKEDISASTKYEDRFINQRLFSWMTRSRVQESSTEAQELIHQKENGLRIYLFIKKSDGEGTDFYYMGQCDQVGYHQTTIQNDKGQELPIMNFVLQLRHAVRSDIYAYFED